MRIHSIMILGATFAAGMLVSQYVASRSAPAPRADCEFFVFDWHPPTDQGRGEFEVKLPPGYTPLNAMQSVNGLGTGIVGCTRD